MKENSPGTQTQKQQYFGDKIFLNMRVYLQPYQHMQLKNQDL
jgi:hypothetical protein